MTRNGDDDSSLAAARDPDASSEIRRRVLALCFYTFEG
jgi:hypothetical protein